MTASGADCVRIAAARVRAAVENLMAVVPAKRTPAERSESPGEREPGPRNHWPLGDYSVPACAALARRRQPRVSAKQTQFARRNPNRHRPSRCRGRARTSQPGHAGGPLPWPPRLCGVAWRSGSRDAGRWVAPATGMLI